MAWRILHSVEEQAYGAKGKADTCYCLQVQFPEGPIIFATAEKGSTTLGIPYLSKYLDQFSNVSIRPVACTLLMSKFFGSGNEVDSHKKLHKLNIALKKLWVTQCSWLRLCTGFSMGMTFTNSWKLFRYEVKRDY